MYIKKADYKKIEENLVVGDFPLNIAVEPGNYCNLNCIMCANDKLKRKRGFMDIKLYKKIVDEIAKENPNTRLWLDFYGEPLLAKYKLYYMIDYAKKRGLTNINMNTNGTLLDDEMIEMILDSGIDFISVDIDGFSKEVYESIRLGAGRDVVYDNVVRLIQKKEERGIRKPILEVKVIEMEENKEEIKEIIDYWSKFKIRINVRKKSTWAGNTISEDNVIEEQRYACAYAIGQCVIGWDGRVAACGWDCEIEAQQGDVNSQTIKEIWNNKRQNLIRLHMEHKFEELPTLCKKCSDWKCVGGELRLDEDGKNYDRNYEANKKMIY